MKKLLITVGIVVTLILAVFVWPTRYREFLYMGKIPYREDRFTGKLFIFVHGRGWVDNEVYQAEQRKALEELSAPRNGILEEMFDTLNEGQAQTQPRTNGK